MHKNIRKNLNKCRISADRQGLSTSKAQPEKWQILSEAHILLAATGAGYHPLFMTTRWYYGGSFRENVYLKVSKHFKHGLIWTVANSHSAYSLQHLIHSADATLTGLRETLGTNTMYLYCLDSWVMGNTCDKHYCLNSLEIKLYFHTECWYPFSCLALVSEWGCVSKQNNNVQVHVYERSQSNQNLTRLASTACTAKYVTHLSAYIPMDTVDDVEVKTFVGANGDTISQTICKHCYAGEYLCINKWTEYITATHAISYSPSHFFT